MTIAGDTQSGSRQAGERLSLLELFLPDGNARQALVLGEACPPVLRPAAREPRPGEPADIVIVAPSRTEWGRERWLEEAARTGAQRLAADGVLFAFLPPARRWRLRRLLAREQLQLATPLLHLPDAAESKFVLPLVGPVARYALACVLETRSWKRRLASLVLALRALTVARWTLGPVALVGRRAGGRPLFDWLDRLAGDQAAGFVLVSRAARVARPAAVVVRLSSASRPSSVAKLRLRSVDSDTLVREAENLERLRAAASGAGADLPTVLASTSVDERQVLIETPVRGRRAATLLAADPDAVAPVLERVTAWLEEWSRATASPTRLTADLLGAELVRAAEAIAPELPNGSRYVEWVRSRSAGLQGSMLPFVATHNDLTMGNVFLAETTIGVVDWEAARARYFPLVDFFYAAADAVAAARAYADRPRAFEEAFSDSGGQRQIISALQARLTSALDLPAEAVELCLHCCWLHHAANEQRTGHPPERPFLAILNIVSKDSLTKESSSGE